MQRFEAFFIPALLAYPFKTRKIQNRYFTQKDFSRENISNMFYKRLQKTTPISTSFKTLTSQYIILYTLNRVTTVAAHIVNFHF